MKKSDEIYSQYSCLNKAADDEILFVLRSKDPAMAATIRFWAAERVRQGLNKSGDEKITSALSDADEVERRQQENKT